MLRQRLARAARQALHMTRRSDADDGSDDNDDDDDDDDDVLDDSRIGVETQVDLQPARAHRLLRAQGLGC